MNMQNTIKWEKKLNKKKKKKKKKNNNFFVYFRKIQKDKAPGSEVLDALYFYLCNGYFIT
ncbi:hypothetical protein DESAMIL20_861 [Desulfurella amilsii]|uniref:Uncharacterized protein n=1 Tax=Desulfurella amilsii TaxID=1562698 RepID=A0A1X4XUW8_9BACT|nr:hypothetical protein DESAMIL20_861 [Desulfurella amilsii]